MGAAMGCVVKKIPIDMMEFKCYSHWGIIHTDWGICKLLIPRDLEAEVTVQINMFGTTKAEEVIFRGLRNPDVTIFMEEIERRLNNAITRYAEMEKRIFVAEGGRLN